MSKRYDVFLSHNSTDKRAVEYLAQKLRESGVEPFLDVWHLIPGEPWQEALEDALDQSCTCAVFLGSDGLGPWENEEMRAALADRVRLPDFRVIPVLLPDAQMPERGRLPRFLSRLTWVDFREGLEDGNALYRLTCGIKGISPGAPEDAVSLREEVCPYRGLQAFHEEHAEFFFGRDALTQWLLEKLRTSTAAGHGHASRFMAVVGPSGSGKSSVVRAGLIPDLRNGALPGSETWTMLVMTPGVRPIEELAARLLPILDAEGDRLTQMLDLYDRLHTDERSLHVISRVALAEKESAGHLLLVVDQLEELFTLCQDEEARERFLNSLLYASSVIQGRTIVVVTMRADFYARAASHPVLSEYLAEHQVPVTPMADSELRQAIEAPARRVGLAIDTGLVDTILEDVKGEPGALPLMQHALLELWERRHGRHLTFDAYREIGGVKGAIARRAEGEYTTLTLKEREIARRVILRLVEPGEGTEDIRRRTRLDELRSSTADAAIVEAVVQKLATARLLTTGRDIATGAELVEISHEALIRGWPRLREWIDENRAAMRTHRLLTRAALEWERHDRDDSYLYRGVRLAEAENWRAENEDDLNILEREFLDESEAQEQREVDARRELERLKQEVQLIQGETAVGKLARDVAHHLKNRVGIVRLSALALLEELGDDEVDVSALQAKSFADRIQSILRNAEAAIELSNTLFRPFVRNPPEWCNINQLLQESIALVGKQSDVAIRLALSENLPEVYIEPQGAVDIFQELMVNALKAVRMCDPPRNIEVASRLSPDGWIEVLFSNNGPPIPKDHWELIFERFPTEKPRNSSEGFGLGLWFVRLFIIRHSGEVYVLDSNDTRTAFVIRLPTADE